MNIIKTLPTYSGGDQHERRCAQVPAYASSVAATGIGCYFDDPVHELLGLSGQEWQDLHHFTVGGAVEDPRLTTPPAYPAPA